MNNKKLVAFFVSVAVILVFLIEFVMEFFPAIGILVSLLLTALSICICVRFYKKPFEGKRRYEKSTHENTATVSLIDQLKYIQAEYDAGRITAEEYKERRIAVLKKSGSVNK